MVHSFRLATFINQSDPAPWLHPHYRASQLLRASPPACLVTGTQPLTVSSVWSSPSRRHPSRQFRDDTFTGSIREPRPGSCCLYAGHHLGSKRVTPRLIPRCGTDPGFDVDLMGFDASTTDIYNHLPGPHLTYSWHAFSCAVHHEPPLTAAAHSGLGPPPANSSPPRKALVARVNKPQMSRPLRRVGGGISAAAPHRSGREDLSSSGSCRSVVRLWRSTSNVRTGGEHVVRRRPAMLGLVWHCAPGARISVGPSG